MSTVNQPTVPNCPVPQKWPAFSLRRKNPRLFALVAATLIASIQGVDPTLHTMAIQHLAKDLITVNGFTDMGTVSFIRSIGTIVLAATMLGIGIIGDHKGRKLLMVYGAYGMAISSAIAAFSSNVYLLGFSRGLMGITTAMAFGMGIAMVPTLYTKEELPKAFSILLAIQSGCVVITTFLGGYILDMFGWRGLYGFVGILILSFGIFGHIVLPENRAEHKRKFDNVGVILAFIGLVLLTYALSQATVRHFFSPVVLGGSAVALVILGVFAWYESRLKEPGFPVVLFKVPAFTAACLAGMMFNFANGTMIGQTTAIIGWINREGWGPAISATTVAGLTSLLGVGMFFGATASGPAVHTFSLSNRAQFVIGMFVLAAGIGSQVFLNATNAVYIVGLGMLIVGFGVMWTQAPESVVVMGSAPKDLIGAVGAVKPGIGQTGFGFGLGVSMPIASIFMDQSKQFTTYAYNMGMLVTVGILLASALAIHLLMRNNDN